MTASFAIGLLFGLTFAAVFFICWRAERHITKELQSHFAGEEDRNHDSYDAGVRTGHLEAELGIVRLDLHTPKRSTETVDWSLDDLFAGSTPKDFPRPRSVTNPNDAA
jgi:hypothetical protein